jgi:hypothetical protein
MKGLDEYRIQKGTMREADIMSEMGKEELKVYVWDKGILVDYGDGLVVAIAKDKEEAIDVSVQVYTDNGEYDYLEPRIRKDLTENEPKVYPIAKNAWMLEGSA